MNIENVGDFNYTNTAWETFEWIATMFYKMDFLLLFLTGFSIIGIKGQKYTLLKMWDSYSMHVLLSICWNCCVLPFSSRHNKATGKPAVPLTIQTFVLLIMSGTFRNIFKIKFWLFWIIFSFPKIKHACQRPSFIM